MYEENSGKKAFSPLLNPNLHQAVILSKPKPQSIINQFYQSDNLNSQQNSQSGKIKDHDKMEIQSKISELTLQESNPENSSSAPHPSNQTQMVAQNEQKESQKGMGEKKSSQNKDTIFNRGLYHVAIAYHIHLKNMKGKVKAGGSEKQINPTYVKEKLMQQLKGKKTGI